MRLPFRHLGWWDSKAYLFGRAAASGWFASNSLFRTTNSGSTFHGAKMDRQRPGRDGCHNRQTRGQGVALWAIPPTRPFPPQDHLTVSRSCVPSPIRGRSLIAGLS